jgi:hypothetical protein
VCDWLAAIHELPTVSPLPDRSSQSVFFPKDHFPVCDVAKKKYYFTEIYGDVQL